MIFHYKCRFHTKDLKSLLKKLHRSERIWESQTFKASKYFVKQMKETRFLETSI